MQTKNKVVSAAEWELARKALLVKEKELTRHRDQIAADREAMPWVKLDKSYTFEGPDGKENLSDLFDGRSQLIIVHFMFGPDWEEGCPGCSFNADSIDGTLPHLNNHDVSLVVVSRAPYEKIRQFQQRMGWKFKWVSSFTSDFNYDFNVSFTPEQIAAGNTYYNYVKGEGAAPELPGMSSFYKDENGQIYHTYSAYARGTEIMVNTYNYLDIAPLGRNERQDGPHPMDWIRHHDKYAPQPANTGKSSCCH
ncbi:DUF899 domain-containing protein [Chitinophaga sp. Hz27]|uniref:DUF899 domain-containing protein n=1 Tax=Chitinophaga sp. Hz27 TaxID=3347169 RepID=UPI0035DC5410